MTGIIVPQSVYVLNNPYVQFPPISFQVSVGNVGGQATFVHGYRLADALDSRGILLNANDQPNVASNDTGRVSIRLEVSSTLPIIAVRLCPHRVLRMLSSGQAMHLGAVQSMCSTVKFSLSPALDWPQPSQEPYRAFTGYDHDAAAILYFYSRPYFYLGRRSHSAPA